MKPLYQKIIVCCFYCPAVLKIVVNSLMCKLMHVILSQLAIANQIWSVDKDLQSHIICCIVFLSNVDSFCKQDQQMQLWLLPLSQMVSWCYYESHCLVITRSDIRGLLVLIYKDCSFPLPQLPQIKCLTTNHCKGPFLILNLLMQLMNTWRKWQQLTSIFAMGAFQLHYLLTSRVMPTERRGKTGREK